MPSHDEQRGGTWGEATSDDIAKQDLTPGVVSYPAVDADPAGYSRRWIALLREELGFRGVVFSDDIGMAAAESAGGVAARLDAHYEAGCDSVLVCAPSLVPDSLDAMTGRSLVADALHPLLGRPAMDWEALVGEPRWAEARATLGIDANV